MDSDQPAQQASTAPWTPRPAGPLRPGWVLGPAGRMGDGSPCVAGCSAPGVGARSGHCCGCRPCGGCGSGGTSAGPYCPRGRRGSGVPGDRAPVPAAADTIHRTIVIHVPDSVR
ncbi:hypothetical protein GCM10012280_69920 [Wenjunlia tyrosinilytica]|uniref:Uncharacterized protein n=1 Tax=Wenjunlia tyrosinilytica TaxID=1544741 RepID=A0A917ZZR2_9ACTN|nr:hypothetical protein GCM10012280_69920 [Wenjunlia tyrosinilytica]